MFSDITHRFGIVEKNFERAQAFFGTSLKGKPLEEWREICTVGERRIQEMDRLAANLSREREPGRGAPASGPPPEDGERA